MWCNTLLGINKGVVQYFGLNKGVGLKQGSGAVLLDLYMGLVEYFWFRQGVAQYLWA